MDSKRLLFFQCLRSYSIGINRFRLVGLFELFRVLLTKKPFLVGLVAQLFQPASNRVETVEKALVATAVVFAGSNSRKHKCCLFEISFILFNHQQMYMLNIFGMNMFQCYIQTITQIFFD